ncbi:uncharacterized protein BJ171DRAFT_489460 [Polychytrium aggregatum]|uniref:uncharacterized protein n=1 Tax=Polychytrium aggregatum TaxID=110093 RepID=UPI0022FE2AE8|nr:uncharacterized protein BJ171DRAFT_489460 [Polychytrium aggregatum]KAI9208591.1 hypothetical protein BJ171DRAFT_489460 [Polychytrium aggregatum]
MAHQQSLHATSLSNPSQFWAEQANSVTWFKRPTSILKVDRDLPAPHYTWFADGELNTCFNALDRHVLNGRGSRTALVYDSPVTNSKLQFTYAQLLEHVQVLAGVLSQHGVKKGDTVLIYMPMVPEAAMAMLACARLGAVHSVVFGGFAAKELAKRIDDCNPSVVLFASCGIEPSRVIPYKPLLDEALSLSKHVVPIRICLQRPQCRVRLDANRGEYDWEDEVKRSRRANLKPECVVVKSGDPLYLLYTSGSTGVPKGVVRDNGGYAVALIWSMNNIFGVGPGETMFTSSDIGWVLGHSFIVYGPLLNGCTTVMYEGKPVGTPDAGAYWRIIQDYRVKVLFTAPTAARAIKREDPHGELTRTYNTSSLRNMYLAGERSDPDTLQHFQALLKVPIRDNYWQTETGWPITVACAFHDPSKSTPTQLGSAGPPTPGYDVKVLISTSGKHKHEVDHDDSHNHVEWQEATEPDVMGTLALKLPLPPGCFPTLWKNHSGYLKSYFSKFPGYFDLTDAGYLSSNGYLNIMSRTDDIINTAGHRLSTGSMEEVVAAHHDVAECAVIGGQDKLKGEIPIGFVVLKHGTVHSNNEIINQLVAAIRKQIGPFACFDRVFIVHRLPKTRSGKILRRILRAIYNGSPYDVPATIDDESVLQEIKDAVRQPKGSVLSAKL